MRKEYKGAAEPLTLLANIASNAATLASAETPTSGWPTGVSYPFVIVLDAGTDAEEKKLISGRSGSTFTVQTHGYDGTSAVAHTANATIEHAWDAASATEASDHIYDTSRDDHTQYQRESEKGNASGYASLDGSGLVPLAQIPQLTAAQLAAGSVDSSEIATGAVGVDEAAQALIDLIWPVGSYRWSAESVAATGWALVDNSSQLRAGTFARLFAVIGTTYGAADGTHFTLPPAPGRTLVAAGTGSGLTARTLGASIGAETVTLTGAQSGIAAHTHVQTAHTHTQDAHTHTQNSHNHTQDAHHHGIPILNATSAAAFPGNASGDGVSVTITTDVVATNQAATATNQNATATNQNTTAVNQSVAAADAASSHTIVQPSLVANLFIKI